MTPRPLEITNDGVGAGVDYSHQEAVATMLTSQHLCEQDDHCMSPSDLKELRKLEGNNFCIDCGTASPDWASITLGIFMCLDCSGKHRAMGTHVSKVRSVRMDAWPDEIIQLMKRGGNKECVKFLKKHGLRGSHSISERYDCAAGMLYQNVLVARRDGLPEPTELPDYTPTRKKSICKMSLQGIGSQHNRTTDKTPFEPSSPVSPILDNLKRISISNAKALEKKGKQVEDALKNNKVFGKAVDAFKRLSLVASLTLDGPDSDHANEDENGEEDVDEDGEEELEFANDSDVALVKESQPRGLFSSGSSLTEALSSVSEDES